MNIVVNGRDAVLVLALVLVTACGVPSSAPDTLSDSTSFPQLRPAEMYAFPAALITGKLELVQGCLRVQASGGNASYAVIWPPWITLNINVLPARISDTQSGVTVQVGDVVKLGGGETNTGAAWVRDLRESLPANCSAPYWISSGLVR